MGQYAKFKENVLYYHLGAFDETYFDIVKQLEQLSDAKKKFEQRQMLVDSMFEKVNSELKGSTYSSNLIALNAEVEKSKEEYSKIVSHLNKVKQTIITLKNQRVEFENALLELRQVAKQTEKDIDLLNEHICPFCKSQILDTTELRASKYNSSDDIIIVSNDAQRSILELNSKIDSASQEYTELLAILKEFDERFRLSSSQVNDVLKHKGFIEVRDSLLNEFGELKRSLEQNKIDIDGLKKEKRKYDASKKAINTKYYELLLHDKTMFGLSEIDEKRFENITRTFTASGSNKPIATVMWYMNLIKLKNQFNPTAIKFPIVFDSPNNAETDDTKKHELLVYLLNNATKDNQLIISTIGFDGSSFEQGKSCNVISLTNEKYHLLNEKEFVLYSDLLFELCNKQ